MNCTYRYVTTSYLCACTVQLCLVMPNTNTSISISLILSSISEYQYWYNTAAKGTYSIDSSCNMCKCKDYNVQQVQSISMGTVNSLGSKFSSQGHFHSLQLLNVHQFLLYRVVRLKTAARGNFSYP